jgi:hypothetical protein
MLNALILHQVCNFFFVLFFYSTSWNLQNNTAQISFCRSYNTSPGTIMPAIWGTVTAKLMSSLGTMRNNCLPRGAALKAQSLKAERIDGWQQLSGVCHPLWMGQRSCTLGPKYFLPNGHLQIVCLCCRALSSQRREAMSNLFN